MLSWIIGIIVLIIVMGIIGIAFQFLKNIIVLLLENKKIGIGIVAVIAFVIYVVNSSAPFAFLKVWGQNIKNFLWHITYKNSIFDTIWIFIVAILLGFLLSVVILSIISDEIKRIICCALITLIAVVIIALTDRGLLSIGMLIESIISMLVLVMYIYNAKRKIGLVYDVSSKFINIEKHIIQIAFVNILTTSGFFNNMEKYFDITIPSLIISFIVNIILLCFEIYWYIYVFKGYKFIKKYIRKNKIFTYSELKEEQQLAYLTDISQYVQSIIEILKKNKVLYKIPVNGNWYINQILKKKIQKLIKDNQSSDLIKNAININLKGLSFEILYKALFADTKGYEIDFTESEETMNRKKSMVGIGAVEFVLMRYPIEQHPILQEDEYVRNAYISALDAIISSGNIDRDKWEAKLLEFKEVFGVSNELISGKEALKLFAEIVKRKISRFKTVKSDYSYMLLLESMYFENLLTEDPVSFQKIERVFEQLKIKNNYRDFIYQYIKSMYIDGDVERAEKLLNSNMKKDVIRVLKYIHNNIMWNERYSRTNQYNVAVCATMSAGKSTFINSLLGMDYIPAKNEACTAKITTIRNNDNIQKLIGCYTRNDGSKVYSNIIDGKMLDEWNEDTNVSETILEGNIEEISCNNGVLVVHDTPGTNNSGDVSHHDKTIDFIANNNVNAIIYIINSEYISTQDTEVLLKELQQIEKDRNVEFIFGLNKIDVFDEEIGENISDIMLDVKKQLETYGFKNPIVFPFSSNAARLFKLVIKGRQLTSREKRTFRNLYEYFQKFDASKYVINAATSNVSDKYTILKEDKIIKLDDDEYSYNEIVRLLGKTGVFNIELWLNQSMANAT